MIPPLIPFLLAFFLSSLKSTNWLKHFFTWYHHQHHHHRHYYKKQKAVQSDDEKEKKKIFEEIYCTFCYEKRTKEIESIFTFLVFSLLFLYVYLIVWLNFKLPSQVKSHITVAPEEIQVITAAQLELFVTLTTMTMIVMMIKECLMWVEGHQKMYVKKEWNEIEKSDKTRKEDAYNWTWLFFTNSKRKRFKSSQSLSSFFGFRHILSFFSSSAYFH